jgi:hypothetical protein
MRATDSIWKLEQWRHRTGPLKVVPSDLELEGWPANVFHAGRHGLLLSIYYYRTVLFITGPILMHILKESTANKRGLPSGIVRDTMTSLLKHELVAAKELHCAIRGILQHDNMFLKRNSVWWVCNYAGKSVVVV